MCELSGIVLPTERGKEEGRSLRGSLRHVCKISFSADNLPEDVKHEILLSQPVKPSSLPRRGGGPASGRGCPLSCASLAIRRPSQRRRTWLDDSDDEEELKPEVTPAGHSRPLSSLRQPAAAAAAASSHAQLVPSDPPVAAGYPKALGDARSGTGRGSPCLQGHPVTALTQHAVTPDLTWARKTPGLAATRPQGPSAAGKNPLVASAGGALHSSPIGARCCRARSGQLHGMG